MGRIMFKVKRGEKVRVFIFSDFSGHAAAWFGHAAACHENTGFVQALHDAAQGKHAATCYSQVFVWSLHKPRHKGIMPRHVALGFLCAD